MPKDYKQTLNEYRKQWELTHSRPKCQRPSLGGDFTQFLMFIPVAVIGPVVSAFRTAALISAHTAFSNPIALWMETIGGTLLFEWAVIAYQAERLRREADGKKKLPPVTTWQIWVGMIAAIGAVTVSNVVEIGVSALERAGVTIDAWLPAVAIGLFIGLGIPVMSLVAGEIVGRFVLEWQTENRKLRVKYDKEMRAWEEQFTRSWDSKKGRLLSDRMSVKLAQEVRVSDTVSDRIPMLTDKDGRIDWIVRQADAQDKELSGNGHNLSDIVDVLELQRVWGVSQRTLDRYMSDIRRRNREVML